MDEVERQSELVYRLLEWFRVEGRDWPWRRSRDRWVVLVSEVCLQQTQVARGAPYVERIVARFPTPADLAAAELGELLTLWSGLGYPRRARNLWLTAHEVAANGWPDDLCSLPGVGPYTSAAIRCFADEVAIVPPDINTRRVLARMFPGGAPSPVEVPALGERAWSWGQGLMEHGQRTCRARARCDSCPVAGLCPSRGTVEVIASPPQARYAGSMRQRRGSLLRMIADHGYAPFDRDAEAAHSLIRDGLAAACVANGQASVGPPVR